MTAIFELSATEVLAQFRARRLSPVEYLEALIQRTESVEPIINAFGDTYFDTAMLAAKTATAKYAKRSSDIRLLEGLPVAVKDEAEIAGKRTTNGSLIWEYSVGQKTDPLVEKLLDAGAYVHARTLTPEFSIAFWTSSKLWGVTRNPWNPKYDVGGSSGGSGASLAAGTTPLATGSDIGGSIRVPASCNGVVGYKPPHGRVPQPAPWGLDHWCHYGPMARTVNDTALMYDAIKGFHKRTAFSSAPRAPIATPSADVRGLRIAMTYDLGDWPTMQSVRNGQSETAAALRGSGAIVDEVPLLITRQMVRDASNAHCGGIFGLFVSETVKGNEHLANPYTLRWLESIKEAPSFLRGLEIEAEIWLQLGEVFASYDALLCPASCISALDAGVDYTEVPYTIGDVKWDAMHDLFPSEVFNPTGICGVMSVPTGRDEQGVPTGTQIIGRPFDDETVFRIAACVERERPWPLVAKF